MRCSLSLSGCEDMLIMASGLIVKDLFCRTSIEGKFVHSEERALCSTNRLSFRTCNMKKVWMFDSWVTSLFIISTYHVQLILLLIYTSMKGARQYLLGKHSFVKALCIHQLYQYLCEGFLYVPPFWSFRNLQVHCIVVIPSYSIKQKTSIWYD